MKQWNSDEELFALMKEKLYTPVVGDILDQMGYKHQFLPANIRPSGGAGSGRRLCGPQPAG